MVQKKQAGAVHYQETERPGDQVSAAAGRCGAQPHLVARNIATLERLTCATPGCLERYGRPTDISPPGLGLAQMPRFHVEQDLKSGALVPLLERTPPPSAPVSLLYHRSRQLSPHVRVFLDRAAREFAARGGRPVDPGT